MSAGASAFKEKRRMVMIEALRGQLYPAILIARLVTLQMKARKNRE
jgi:hypothetical protein